MRKVLATTVFVLMSSGLGAKAAAAVPTPPDQAHTMEEVIDRVTARENELNQEIRKYSPLVETYIQNLKPDKDLGSAPAGDKYFLGKADFAKGVNLVSLTDVDPKGKKIFTGIGNFFSFAMQYLPDGFLQMIFIDTTGFDKAHYKFDYVKREFLGEVRCLVFDVTPLPKSGFTYSSVNDWMAGSFVLPIHEILSFTRRFNHRGGAESRNSVNHKGSKIKYGQVFIGRPKPELPLLQTLCCRRPRIVGRPLLPRG